MGLREKLRERERREESNKDLSLSAAEKVGMRVERSRFKSSTFTHSSLALSPAERLLYEKFHSVFNQLVARTGLLLATTSVMFRFSIMPPSSLYLISWIKFMILVSILCVIQLDYSFGESLSEPGN